MNIFDKLLEEAISKLSQEDLQKEFEKKCRENDVKIYFDIIPPPMVNKLDSKNAENEQEIGR